MEELLTIEETCDYLRLSQSTVRRMVKDGRIPARQIGRQWRIPLTALETMAAGKALGDVEPSPQEAPAARVFVLEMLAAGGRTWSTTAHRTLASAQAEAERRAAGSLGIGSAEPHEPVTWAQDAEAPGGREWAGAIGGRPVARIGELRLRD